MIIDTIKYRYNLLKNAVITGDFSNVISEIKSHLFSNKNTYICLTFLVILYVLYEHDIHTLLCIIRKNKQTGGETASASNTLDTHMQNTSSKKALNESSNKTINTQHFNSNGSSSTSRFAQNARGLCDGNGLIAKMCRGGKDGVYNYFKLFGYIILAGLAVLSPFVIYIVLVYMMLKIMFTGLKRI